MAVACFFSSNAIVVLFDLNNALTFFILMELPDLNM
jgi:hypothetical protein